MARGTKNPAEGHIPSLPPGYKPMTTGVKRLEVPDKEGYHRHWFRGTPDRLQRAQQAGYRFVDKEDLGDEVNNFDLAGDSAESGNSDMGTRVSVVSGDDVGGNGQPARMYLMECPDELFEYAQSVLADRNGQIADALMAGEVGKGKGGENQEDMNKTYLRNKPSDLFKRKTGRH